jgi:spore coat protein U-like protein
MTRPIRSPLLALGVASIAALIASPALAAGASGPTEAVIVSPLSLVNTEDLDFGTLISGPLPGTATIDASTGARSVTGGVVAAGGTPKRAEFVGVGTIGLLSLVSMSAAPLLSNGTGGTMVSALVMQGGTGLRLFPGTGVQTFRVGGTLTVGANQAVGTYAGTFTVTVAYF